MTAGKLIGSPLYRIVIAQVIATILASASCLALDRVAAVSALAAGFVTLVPGVYLLVVSQHAVSRTGGGLAQALKGELGRLVITGCLFAMVFMFVRPLDVVAFFATFVLLQSCFAIVPWLEARRLLKH